MIYEGRLSYRLASTVYPQGGRAQREGIMGEFERGMERRERKGIKESNERTKVG